MEYVNDCKNQQIIDSEVNEIIYWIFNVIISVFVLYLFCEVRVLMKSMHLDGDTSFDPTFRNFIWLIVWILIENVAGYIILVDKNYYNSSDIGYYIYFCCVAVCFTSRLGKLFGQTEWKKICFIGRFYTMSLKKNFGGLKDNAYNALKSMSFGRNRSSPANSNASIEVDEHSEDERDQEED